MHETVIDEGFGGIRNLYQMNRDVSVDLSIATEWILEMNLIIPDFLLSKAVVKNWILWRAKCFRNFDPQRTLRVLQMPVLKEMEHEKHVQLQCLNQIRRNGVLPLIIEKDSARSFWDSKCSKKFETISTKASVDFRSAKKGSFVSFNNSSIHARYQARVSNSDMQKLPDWAIENWFTTASTHSQVNERKTGNSSNRDSWRDWNVVADSTNFLSGVSSFAFIVVKRAKSTAFRLCLAINAAGPLNESYNF